MASESGLPRSGGRPMRSDAARNRDRIIRAARTVFAEQGLDASLNEVARKAGVGIATLFRRFPTREDLIAATFEDKMAAYAALTKAALEDPDPWHAFCNFVEQVCEMQVEDRGFTEVLMYTFPTAEHFDAEYAQASQAYLELIARAKASGRLRPDFDDVDLPVALMANAGVVAVTADTAPNAWRRFVAYLLQGFAASEGASTLPDPPAPDQLAEAVQRVGRRAAQSSTSTPNRPPHRA